MSTTILVKRGAEANLPQIQPGELIYAIDKRRLYVGSGSAAKEIEFNQLSSSGLFVSNPSGLSKINLQTYGSVVAGNASITSQVAGGTVESPSQTLNGHYTSIQMQSWGGTSWSTSGRILFQAWGDHTESSRPTNITFSTVPSGSTGLVDRMKINGSGVFVSGTLGVTGSLMFSDGTQLTTAAMENAVTASYIATASWAMNAVSASWAPTSFDGTASYVDFVNVNNTPTLISSSNQVTMSWSVNSTTASTASFVATSSWSNNSRTASYVDYTSIANKPTLISSSAQFTSANNVTFGQITASAINVTNLYVQTITSSVDYASGSNIFGTKSADTHRFTGSLFVTGSVTAFSFIGTASVATTASYVATSSWAINSSTASFISTASWANNAQTASYVSGLVTSASYASTASFLLGSIASSSYSTHSYEAESLVVPSQAYHAAFRPLADPRYRGKIMWGLGGTLGLAGSSTSVGLWGDFNGVGTFFSCTLAGCTALSVSYLPTDVFGGGIILNSTGAASGSWIGHRIYPNTTTAVVYGTGDVRISKFRFSFASNSATGSATDNVTIRFGCQSGTTADSDTSGAYVKYNYAVNSGKLQFVANGSAGILSGDTGITPVVGTTYDCVIEEIAQTSSKLWINGTLVSTLATGINRRIGYLDRVFAQFSVWPQVAGSTAQFYVMGVSAYFTNSGL